MNISKQVIKVLSDARENGIIARGYLEVTRSIQQRKAKLVIIAQDIDDPKMFLEMKRLCNKYETPLLSVLDKKGLGGYVGLDISTGFVSIKTSGFLKREFLNLINLVAKAKSQ